jgi:hypothetical protein
MPESAQEKPTAPSARRRKLGILRFSAVEMLVALILLIVAAAFIEGFPGGELIEAILMSLFFLSAVLAVGGRHRMLLMTAGLALPAIAAKWLNHLQPEKFPPAIFLVIGIVFLVVVVVNTLRFVLRAPRVNSEILCASISAYLTLGLLWGLAYRLVSSLSPAAFSFNSTQVLAQPMEGFTAFYFSYVTLSTVGYGDITPVSHVARMLAVTESMTGTLYVAVLIARLVALYSIPPVPSDPSDNPDPSQP